KVLAIGTVTSQTLYALEQEIELVLGIAMIFGHELSGSEGRVLEALVVVGVTSGSLKLREDVLVAGGERLAVAAFRRVPNLLLVHGSGRFITRILARLATHSVSLPRDHRLSPPGMRPGLARHSSSGISVCSGLSLAISSFRSAALKDEV